MQYNVNKPYHVSKNEKSGTPWGINALPTFPKRFKRKVLTYYIKFSTKYVKEKTFFSKFMNHFGKPRSNDLDYRMKNQRVSLRDTCQNNPFLLRIVFEQFVRSIPRFSVQKRPNSIRLCCADFKDEFSIWCEVLRGFSN